LDVIIRPNGSWLLRNDFLRGSADEAGLFFCRVSRLPENVRCHELDTLGRRENIDLELMRRVLAGSAASSSFIRHDLDALFEGDYLTSFGLDRCCEELSAITALARQDGVPFELSDHVEQTYQRALARYGPADGELLPVAMLEEQAGVKLRARP
jgi:hypothetical protein